MKLLLASGNKHKLDEFRDIFRLLDSPFLIEGMTIPDVVETGVTYYQNAFKKARVGLRQISGTCDAADTVVLADDSGLELDGYAGMLGVRSARYVYNGMLAQSGLIAFLQTHEIMAVQARFVCCIVAFMPGASRCISCVGTVRGTVMPESRGAGGFGYDSLFTVAGMTLTLGELPAVQKDRVSHRALAAASFLHLIQDTGQLRP